MTVKEAIEKRRSTRYYDTEQKISEVDIETIIEAGRRAPNGFGLEPWKFLVLSGDMSKIKDSTYGQEHIQDASHVVALVNYKQNLVDQKPEVFKKLLAKKVLLKKRWMGILTQFLLKERSTIVNN